MSNKVLKIIVIVFAVIIVILLGTLIFVKPVQGPTVPGTSTTGTPQPLVSSDGHLAVTAPIANATIASPVSVSGSVTGGGWFFEAVFPVKVLDGDGTVLGQGPAQAGGEPGSWMTTDTVPFSAMMTFTTPKYATGTVVFAKDNPSGLPQNAGELRVSVRFK